MQKIWDKSKSRNVIKKAIKITAFILVFLMLFVYFSYLCRPVDYNREIIAGFYTEEKNELDAVYIGGSVCFVSWAPLIAFREQGIASCNYSVNTMAADTIKYCIKDVFKTQSPKLLVIDARPFAYRDVNPPKEVPIRNLSDSMSYSYLRTEMILDIVPKVLKENSLNYIFDISKYHECWKSLTKASFDYGTNKKVNVTKGFCFQPFSVVIDTPSDKKTITEQTSPSQLTIDILNDTMASCKDKGINVLFVVAPYAESNEHRMVYNSLREHIESYGYDFVNFNDYYSDMNFDFSNDFFNEDHLNIFGAEKYTSFLAQYITENYQLPDRRSDANYSDWLDLLPEWDESVDTTKHIIEKSIISNITDINEFFTYFNDDRYSIYITIKGGIGKTLDPKLLSSLSNLGLTVNFENLNNSSYIALIDKGSVICEESGNDEITTAGQISGGINYSVFSAGSECGNNCSIKINDTEYAMNTTGINVVVYDNECHIGSVVDSVCFDASSNTFTVKKAEETAT